MAYTVLRNLSIDTCSQDPYRAMMAQHGKNTPRLPYFTCQSYRSHFFLSCVDRQRSHYTELLKTSYLLSNCDISTSVPVEVNRAL